MDRRIAVAVAGLLVLCGACTGAAETYPDPDLPLVQNLGTIDEGVTYRYNFYIHCGMKWIESLNGTTWVSEDPIYRGSGRAPERLREFFVDTDEVISPVLRTRITLVAEDEIRLTLPDGSETSTYRSTDQAWPGCA